MKQRISRGYTRAADYLFDSDDDAPMPKPHLPLNLHPPPPKQRCQVESARSAESARIAKHCTERLHLTNPLHNESAQPCLPQCMNLLHHHPRLYQSPTRAPAASASKPKPAKGCMRIPPHQDPVKPGRQWPMPPISEGVDNVGDGAPWRSIAVGQYHKMSWPLWGRNVTDLRPKTSSVMVASRLLRHALETAVPG